VSILYLFLTLLKLNKNSSKIPSWIHSWLRSDKDLLFETYQSVPPVSDYFWIITSDYFGFAEYDQRGMTGANHNTRVRYEANFNRSKQWRRLSKAFEKSVYTASTWNLFSMVFNMKWICDVWYCWSSFQKSVLCLRNQASQVFVHTSIRPESWSFKFGHDGTLSITNLVLIIDFEKNPRFKPLCIGQKVNSAKAILALRGYSDQQKVNPVSQNHLCHRRASGLFQLYRGHSTSLCRWSWPSSCSL
jgi:hypothetical protein